MGKAIIKDTRTDQERKTHTWAVIGTDTFLSGYGDAHGKISYAGWAFDTMDIGGKILKWVKSRGDMKRIRVVNLKTYRPRGSVHITIYCPRPGKHPVFWQDDI